MVVDTAAQSIQLMKLLRKRNVWVVAVAVVNGLICSDWEFHEHRMVDKLGVSVERKLIKYY